MLNKLVGTLGALVLAVAMSPAFADYPDRPVTLVVPFAPGGNIDVTGRIVAEGLTRVLKQSFVVENRPGAGSVVGAEYVARAKPDGYTLLLGSSGGLATSRAVRPDMNFDPEKSLMGVASVARAPLLLVVNAGMPVHSVADFIAYAKARPGKVTIASSGAGTAAHLTAEQFQLQAGIKLIHVPYRGSAPAVNDLLGGQVDATFDQLASTLPQINAGKLRALGITSAKRSPIVPDVPTLAEAGLGSFESSTTAGVMVPAGTPMPIVDKLNAAIAEVLKSPEVTKRFADLGSDVVFGSGQDFDRILQSEIAKWTQVVRDAHVKVD